MLPSKHLPPQGNFEKPDAISIEIARLKTPAGYSIPIVALTHTDHICLYWWDYSRWLFRTREHSTYDHLEYWGASNALLSDRLFNPLIVAPWSHRVGLAAGDQHVFLIYKRKARLANGYEEIRLFLDVFKWDENLTERHLKPLTQYPVEIPPEAGTFSGPGYYMWAGFYEDTQTKQLLILTQATPKGGTGQKLILLTTGAYADPEALADGSNWHAPVVLDDGGFDFHAYPEGDKLHLIYRKSVYPLAIPIPEEPFESPSSNINLEIPIDPETHPYASLTLRTLQLPSGNTIDLLDNIPGGEHPQIQRLNPLLITVDRITSGSSINLSITQQLPGRSIISLSPSIRESQKVLLRRHQGSWYLAYLMPINEQVETRNQSARDDYNKEEAMHSQFDELVCISPDRKAVLYAKPHDQKPIYLTRYIRTPALLAVPPALEADFLHHSAKWHGLLVSRWHFKENAPSTIAQYTGYAIFDMNHEQILPPPPPLPPIEPADQENTQFEPFEVKPIKAPSQDGNPLLYLGPKRVDNTLGGALIMEPSLSGVKFAAYTDLGDGGTRVIFDDQLPNPNPVFPVDPKKGDPEAAVSGPVSVGDEWVTLSHTGEWQDYGLHQVANSLLVSGFDAHLDSAISIFGNSLTKAEFQRKLLIWLGILPLGYTSGKSQFLPRAKLDTYSLEFSGVAGRVGPQSVRISPVQGDTLGWPRCRVDSSRASPWLEIVLSTTAENVYDMQVVPRLDTLVAPGWYPAVISVEAGWNQPQCTLVNLQVNTLQASVLLATPALNFSSSGPLEQSVRVMNGGVAGTNLGPLTMVITYSTSRRDWLQATVEGQVIKVTITNPNLPAGTHSARVRVSDPGSTAELLVQFYASTTIQHLIWGPDSLDFVTQLGEGNPPGKNFCITTSETMSERIPLLRAEVVWIDNPDSWQLHTTVFRSPGDFNRYWCCVQPVITTPAALVGTTTEAIVRLTDPYGIATPRDITITLKVDPPSSYAAFSSPAIIYVGLEVLFDASTSFVFGCTPADLKFDWEIKRINEEGEWEIETISRPGEPVLKYTFIHANSTYIITLTVTPSSPASGQPCSIQRLFTVEQSPWDRLWDFYDKSQSTTAYAIWGIDILGFKLLKCTISFSKYDLTFKSEEPKEVKIASKSEYCVETDDNKYFPQYSFQDADLGQGRVAMRLPIAFHSENIEVTGAVGPFFAVDEVREVFYYGRAFTPAILTKDESPDISGNQVDTLHKNPSGLSAKPIESPLVTPDSVNVKGRLKILGHLLLGLVAVIVGYLTQLGILWLAALILSEESARWLAINIPYYGWIIFIILTIVLIITMELLVPPALEGKIESELTAQINSEAFRRTLNQSDLLTGVGAGLAETIATEAIDLLNNQNMNIPNNLGKNRWLDDFWQRIFVTKKKAMLLVRK